MRGTDLFGLLVGGCVVPQCKATPNYFHGTASPAVYVKLTIYRISDSSLVHTLLHIPNILQVVQILQSENLSAGMSRRNMLQMSLVFLWASQFVISQGLPLSCAELTLCNLIKGDIANVTAKYGEELARKYISEAEKSAKQHIMFLKNNDDSIRKKCEKSEVTCSEEAENMAIEGLGLPEAYRKLCSYRSYSANLFGCLNVHNWPEALASVLPNEFTSCQYECLVSDGIPTFNTIISLEDKSDANRAVVPNVRWGLLTNGYNYAPAQRSKNKDRAVVKYVSAILNILCLISAKVGSREEILILDHISVQDCEELGVVAVELQSCQFNETLKVTMSGFGTEDYSSAAGWGQIDTCPNNSWVDTSIHARTGQSLFHIDILCRDINNNGVLEFSGHLVSDTARNIGIWGGVGIAPANYRASHTYPCRNAEDYPGAAPKAYIVGMALHMGQHASGSMKYLKQINHLCAYNGSWTKFGSSDSNKMVCPNRTAVCSAQTKISMIDGERFITDIRIGCCDGDPGRIENFVQKWVPPADNITLTRFQTGLKFLFWESVHSISTSWYYTLTSNIKDRAGFTRSYLCGSARFVIGFQIELTTLTDHVSGQAMTITLECGHIGQIQGIFEILNVMVPLHQMEFSSTSTTGKFASHCHNSSYNAAKLVYYTDKRRPYLANAWSFGMYCISDARYHNHTVNAVETNILEENGQETSTSECPKGEAICGASTRYSEKTLAAREAVNVDFKCCAAPAL